MQPLQIRNHSDLVSELISLQSVLNMQVLDHTVLTQSMLISDTYWGSHAMEHLQNIINYIIKEDKCKPTSYQVNHVQNELL